MKRAFEREGYEVLLKHLPDPLGTDCITVGVKKKKFDWVAFKEQPLGSVKVTQLGAYSKVPTSVSVSQIEAIIDALIHRLVNLDEGTVPSEIPMAELLQA